MARRFLYLVAFGIVLAIAGAFALNIWSRELTRLAFVPTTEFAAPPPLAPNAYHDPGLWYSRPGIGVSDPARWQPAMRNVRGGTDRLLPDPATQQARPFAVFFVHPTSYYERAAWNAPWQDPDADATARLFLKGTASPFNRASEIWAPKYRQATMGAMLTDDPRGQRALDAAYADVAQAFRFFLESVGPKTPIILAGHSQGALHLLSLLRREVADKPLADRIAAAYVVGWPISLEHDLQHLGLPACAAADQAGCILSWSSFADPADPADLLQYLDSSTGFDGNSRRGSHILCTNPLTGGTGGVAGADRNLGTLVPGKDFGSGELVAGYAAARCDTRGLLLIGEPPKMGNAVLPGNNYHVYDIPLFWRNVQLDSEQRVDAWYRRHK